MLLHEEFFKDDGFAAVEDPQINFSWPLLTIRP
jgi:hypothetical protein